MQSKNTETLNSPAINDTPINLRIPLVLLLLVLILSIVVAALLSVCIGVAGSSFSEVLVSRNKFSSESTIHQVIRELRFPRVVGAALVGAALALLVQLCRVLGIILLRIPGYWVLTLEQGLRCHWGWFYSSQLPFVG